MTKRLQSIISKAAPALLIAALLLVWQGLSSFGIVPGYMLPSPVQVVRAFAGDFTLLMSHAETTLAEAFLGLLCGVALAFCTAALMDRFALLRRSVYPLLILSQTIPTVAIAPLLVLWLGYGIAPKVTLIVITCYFPMTISLLTGFASVDPDTVRLMRAMGAGKGQIFRHIKLPGALPHFFSGIRVAVSYSVVGAVISEWLGGLSGLGVYMTRVKKSYAFDKMFAVILLISVISLLLIKGVSLLERKLMPWHNLRARPEEPAAM